MKTPVCTAVFALLLATSTNAGAATKIWIGPEHGDWYEPGNWSPPGVPAGNDTINIAGGSVDATLPVTIASGGALNCGGFHLNFSGGLTIANGGVLNVGLAGALSLHCGVTNAGTIRWTSGFLFVTEVIVNQLKGLIDVQTENTIRGEGLGAILNAGMFLKSAGSGVTTVYVPFTNTTGTVEAQSGPLSLAGGGVFEGNFHAAAGAAIQLAGGAFTYNTPPNFPGPGAIQLAGATLTLVNNPIPNLQMVSGTVILSPVFQGGTITNLSLGGSVTLNGDHTVSGVLNGTGVVYGDLAIASGATVNWSGVMNGYHTIASGGTLNWTGTHESYLLGGLTIASGGVFNVGQTLRFYGGVTNAGTFRWTNGYIVNENVIVNQPNGLIDAQSDQSIGGGAILNAGVFRKSAGSGITAVDVPFTNTTGTVQAHTGTIAFRSAFHQTPAATLAISIGGATPGTDYGHIDFAEPLALDGAFTASTRNGFDPNPGEVFNALSYPSFTGEFTCLRGIDLGGGIVLFPAVLPKGMTLTAASSAPSAPTVFATRWAGGVRLLRPPGFSDWEFVATTNLFTPVWTPVPSPGCDQVTLPVTAPQQYFRLRKSN